MPNDPRDPYGNQMTQEEYRRRQAAKAKRRKKRQRQRLLLLAAFVVAAVLLVVVIVVIIRAIFGGGGDDSSKSASPSSSIVKPAEPPPTSGPGISWTVAPDPSVWNLILVNNQYPLPEGFSLADDQIKGITYGEGTGAVTYFFDTRIMEELDAMIKECNAVEGHSLQVVSGLRGADTQNDKYNYLVTYYKSTGLGDAEAEMVARQIDPPAGYSEHQTGLAVDFVTGTVTTASDDFVGTPEFTWLTKNAARFGFILRYPSEKEAITGIRVQPYHWRYVGVEAATTMANEGRCLEEYLAKMPEANADDSGNSNADGGADGSGDDGSDAGGDQPG